MAQISLFDEATQEFGVDGRAVRDFYPTTISFARCVHSPPHQYWPSHDLRPVSESESDRSRQQAPDVCNYFSRFLYFASFSPPTPPQGITHD